MSAGTAYVNPAFNPVVNSVSAGTNVTITGTNANPIVNASGSGGGGVTSIVAGTGITVTGTASVPNIATSQPLLTYYGSGNGIYTLNDGNNISFVDNGGGDFAINGLVNNNTFGGTVWNAVNVGTGISGGVASGTLTLANTAVVSYGGTQVNSIIASTGVSGSLASGVLTLTSPLTGGGSQVSALTAGTGMTLTNTGGSLAIATTVTNPTYSGTAITSFVAGTNITLTAGGGALTIGSSASPPLLLSSQVNSSAGNTFTNSLTTITTTGTLTTSRAGTLVIDFSVFIGNATASAITGEVITGSIVDSLGNTLISYAFPTMTIPANTFGCYNIKGTRAYTSGQTFTIAMKLQGSSTSTKTYSGQNHTAIYY